MNLLASNHVRPTADGSRTEDHGPEHAINGLVIREPSSPQWESPTTPVPHWIAFEFAEPVVWNQLVVYWPQVRIVGPWHPDSRRTVIQGLRATTLFVEARIEDRWTSIDVREIRPGGYHDGRFARELYGLDETPASRLDHLRDFENWREAIVRHPDASPEDEDCVIDAEWRIAITPPDSEILRLAAEDLRDTLERLIGARLVIETLGVEDRTTPVDEKRIVIGPIATARRRLDATAPSAAVDSLLRACDDTQAHVLLVEPTRVWALGFDSLGARYAACRAEERLQSRGGPFLRIGGECRSPAFRPRAGGTMAFGEGGPDGLGFPDGYLSLMVHHYLDSVFIFQNGFYLNSPSAVVGSSLDDALAADEGKIAQLNGLIHRAGQHGLGVYWMLTVPGALPPEVYERHPDLRGRNPGRYVVCLSTDAARELVRDGITRVARAFPELTGVVVLRSEFSHTCGGRQQCPGCRDEAPPDADPVRRILDWIAEAIAQQNSTLEIIAFDWRGGGIAPLDISELPPGVAYWTRPQTRFESPENNLQILEPSAEFKAVISELDNDHRLWIEGQFSHPFPLHTIPDLPTPSLYWQKWTRVRELVGLRGSESPLPAFCMGNGSAVTPYAMQELCLRTLLWNPLPGKEEALRSLSSRTFGSSVADEVLDAWRLFDDALRRYTTIDKYVTRETLVSTPGTQEIETSDDQLVAIEGMCGQWAMGCESLRAALERADPTHRERAAVHVKMAEATLFTLRSWKHAVEWHRTFGRTWLGAKPLPREISRLASPQKRQRAREILDAEIENTAAYIGLASSFSVLRSHPYYRHWFGLGPLVEKLGVMRDISEQLARAETID